MDYDKLIERHHKEAYGSDIEELLLDAATAIETLRADLARTMKERNAAIQYLREFDVCAGCKYFKDGVCRNDKSGLCTDENDLYEFAMPEDSNVC